MTFQSSIYRPIERAAISGGSAHLFIRSLFLNYAVKGRSYIYTIYIVMCVCVSISNVNQLFFFLSFYLEFFKIFFMIIIQESGGIVWPAGADDHLKTSKSSTQAANRDRPQSHSAPIYYYLNMFDSKKQKQLNFSWKKKKKKGLGRIIICMYTSGKKKRGESGITNWREE